MDNIDLKKTCSCCFLADDIMFSNLKLIGYHHEIIHNNMKMFVITTKIKVILKLHMEYILYEK